MNKHTKKALEMVVASKPASGFRPETPQEWDALQRANEELGFALFKQYGMPSTQARHLAQLIYSGPAGRILLDLAFKDDKNA